MNVLTARWVKPDAQSEDGRCAAAGRNLLRITAAAFAGSAPPQDDVVIALQRSHALLADTAQLFDALDARANFEPIMQSVRDLNKLDDS